MICTLKYEEKETKLANDPYIEIADIMVADSCVMNTEIAPKIN